MRSGELDVAGVGKHSQAIINLAKLKYVSEDSEFEMCKNFLNVLKLGLSYKAVSERYAATGDTTTIRVTKDSDDKQLERVNTCCWNFLEAAKEFQESIESNAATDPLNGLNISMVFAESESDDRMGILFDAIGFKATQVKSQLERCGSNASKIIAGMDRGGEQFWRRELGDDADMATLKQTSKGSLKKVDGATFKNAVESLSKA